jgi:hypothetical protein
VRIVESATWNVRFWSWLCESAKTRDGDRRSYSSKTALTVKRASELNLTNGPKNVILAAFQSFAFLHSQGQKATSPIHQALVSSTPETSWPFATDVGNGLRADVALFEILPSSFAIGKHLEP